MASRLHLHNEFIDVLGTANEQESRVYFNSPESVKMKYDCIRYNLSTPDVKRANNAAYMITDRYDGVVISRNPDCDIPKKLLVRFSMCSIGSPYKADSLYHFPFTIYY